MRSGVMLFSAALTALTVLLGMSCKEQPQKIQKGALTIAVSIEPQAFFAGRVGGASVAVQVMVPPGQSPATYEPTPKQMAQLQEAQVYFRIGVPFENRFIGKIESIIGAGKVTDVRQGIDLRPITGHVHQDDTAAGEQLDPHIWLDPALAKTQARTMASVFEELAPQNKDYYEKNLTRFDNALDSVDAIVRELLAPYQGEAIYVYHPSYGYFLERYGLRQVAVEQAGHEPSARELSELITRAKADSVTTLFVQPQFAQQSVEAIADAIGAKVVELDPLSADYLNNLTLMARRISLALALRHHAGN